MHPILEMPSHEEVVSQVSAAVKALFSRHQSFRIFHGSTSSTRPQHHDRVVDISALSNVLSIDKASRTAIVEPNVPMDKLVRETLTYGLIPPVVMEFPGITVGGGFAGSAGESSSFKFGYFDQTVRKTEMVLATGETVTASNTENPDLFKGAAGAMGTLGITTRLELNLITAKRFVKLEYYSYSSINETIAALEGATGDSASDYVDGIIFSETHGVLMTGQLTDDIPSNRTPQTFSGSWDPWFYLHVKSQPQGTPQVDYIPIAEYLFRYDRGGFWVGAEAFRYFKLMPFNKLTRWFLNDFMHTRMLYRAMHGADMTSALTIQDVSLPYETAEDFINYNSGSLGIWPLWLCPLRGVEQPTFHPSSIDPRTAKPAPMLNIGIWGTTSRDRATFVRENMELEKHVTALGGRKVLYAHTYYTAEQFWALYDKDWYDGLREQFTAQTLPSVYEKIKVARQNDSQLPLSLLDRLRTIRPIPAFVGIWHAIRSKDYMIHRGLDWMQWKIPM